MRQELLQIAVGRTYQQEIGAGSGSKTAHSTNLTRDANQRIFRRLITIGRRVSCWTLNMRIIIRRPGAEIDDFNPKSRAQIEKFECLGKIQFEGIVGINSKSVVVRQAMSIIFGTPGPGLPGFDKAGSGLN